MAALSVLHFAQRTKQLLLTSVPVIIMNFLAMSTLSFTYNTDATERCPMDGGDDTQRFPIFTYSKHPPPPPPALSQVAQCMSL
jgi:hypothetical protein